MRKVFCGFSRPRISGVKTWGEFWGLFRGQKFTLCGGKKKRYSVTVGEKVDIVGTSNSDW